MNISQVNNSSLSNSSLSARYTAAYVNIFLLVTVILVVVLPGIALLGISYLCQRSDYQRRILAIDRYLEGRDYPASTSEGSTISEDSDQEEQSVGKISLRIWTM